MDDTTAFERLVASRLRHHAGPALPVDDGAVYHSVVAATQSPKWRFPSMFSATKFVVAGAIVALFGGFLLAGVMTTPGAEEVVPAAATASSSPTTTDELLSSMVAEEVEPGVLRIVSDGIRDVAGAVPFNGMTRFDIAAGYDGSVWLYWPDAFFQLGDASTYLWGDQPGPSLLGDIEVGPDGTMWRVEGPGYSDFLNQGPGRLWSFDGESWTDHERPGDVYGVEVRPDGTIWSAWAGSVGRLDGGRWTIYDVPATGTQNRSLTVSDDGVVWVEPGDGSFYRLDGQEWTEATPPFPELRTDQPMVAGRGGTLWVRLWSRSPDLLAVLDDTTWTVYDEDDGVPPMAAIYGEPGPMEIAPDGTLWVMPHGEDEPHGEDDWCGGMASFDRVAWTRYLPGTCVFGFDIALDGSVWLQGSDQLEGPALTYVITPEAVAATE